MITKLPEIAKYANNQADMAQSRLLKNDKPLYDDTYWQPVLDRIRFDLIQLEAALPTWTKITNKTLEAIPEGTEHMMTGYDFGGSFVNTGRRSMFNVRLLRGSDVWRMRPLCDLDQP